MKFIILLNFTLFIFMGCADLAENPTDTENFVVVPETVLNIIDGRCTICHQPESPKVFKGQMPYFRKLLPDSSTTLDTLQIWQARKRISLRVSEGTMPRASDTLNIFDQLPQDQIDLIFNWAN